VVRGNSKRINITLDHPGPEEANMPQPPPDFPGVLSQRKPPGDVTMYLMSEDGGDEDDGA
jgi:hypothetical protein